MLYLAMIITLVLDAHVRKVLFAALLPAQFLAQLSVVVWGIGMDLLAVYGLQAGIPLKVSGDRAGFGLDWGPYACHCPQGRESWTSVRPHGLQGLSPQADYQQQTAWGSIKT